MRQFRVVLRGPGGGVPAQSGEASLRAQLGDLSSSHPWFRPEAVRVRLSRPLRAVRPPLDWELPLVGKAAALTLATAGMLGGLSGGAEASPQRLMPVPPGLESSSQAPFMPTDRTPEVVLLEAREVRGADSLRFTSGAPLTDERGNPVLIAAYHSNLDPTPHSNAHPSSHTNAAWPNHSNLPGTHSDTQWQNHGNIPDSTGGFHTNMVQGDYVF